MIRRACCLDDVAKLEEFKTSVVRDERTFLGPRICLKERMKEVPDICTDDVTMSGLQQCFIT